MDTIVVEHELGAVLKYPESFTHKLVDTPYGHPSTHQKYATGEKGKAKKKKTKKRKLNRGEALQQQYHSQIEERLTMSYQTLLSLGKNVNYFPVSSLPHSQDHCTPSLDLVSLCNLDALIPISNSPNPLLLDPNEKSENHDLFGHVVFNNVSTDLTIRALGTSFTIPSNSSFLLSDLTKIDLLLSLPDLESSKFNLVVMDPPWENRSAIRGKKYAWISNQQLLQIPLPSLVAPGAIVAVWVTNKCSIVSFVRNELFPEWGIEYLGEWHWIKVTTTGDMVWPLDSAHKKPYETLLIGRVSTSSLELIEQNVTYCKEQQSSNFSCLASLDKSLCSAPDNVDRHDKSLCSAPDNVDRHDKSLCSAPDNVDRHDKSPCSAPDNVDRHDKSLCSAPDNVDRHDKSPCSAPDNVDRHDKSLCSAPDNVDRHKHDVDKPNMLESVDKESENSSNRIRVDHFDTTCTQQLFSENLPGSSEQVPPQTAMASVNSVLAQNSPKGIQPDTYTDEPPAKKVKIDADLKKIPSRLSFLAVPSSMHSQKPYLGDLLCKYLPRECRKLELFARNLLPGWTSWGNEVVKFQKKED